MSSGYDNPNLLSQAQLDRQAALTLEQNQQDLLSAVQLRADDDGKVRVLGMEVSPAIARSINLVTSTALIPVAESASGFMYNQTKRIAEKIPKLSGKAPKVALAAELTTIWGLFAARPISKFVGANSDYTTKRFKLSKDIKSICEASGADYTKNEVVRAAYHDLHENWMDDLKTVIPSLLAVVPHTLYATKLTGDAVTARNREMKNAEALAKLDKEQPGLSADELRLQHARARANERSQLRATERKDFERRYAHEGWSKPQMNERFEEHMRYMEAHLGEDHLPAQDGKKPKGFLKRFMDNSNDSLSFTMFAGVAQALGDELASSMQKKQRDRKDKSSSLEMIQRLEEQMQGGMGAREVQARVVEIFQRLEEEMGRTRFAGGLAEKLEESVKPIAENIANGRLSALALVKLAGEHQVIQHGEGGKRTFRSQAEVEAAIEASLGNTIKMNADVSAEEFIASFANPLLAKETIKNNLQTMQGAEKDFFISVMPVEILQQAGMKKKDIQEHRRAAHERFYNEVAAGIIHIASLDEEALRSYGVSAEHIANIRALNEQIMAGDMESLKIAVDSRDSAVSTVAQVGLAEQLENSGDGKGYWVQRTRESGNLAKVICEAAHRDEPVAESAPKTEEVAEEKVRGIRKAETHVERSKPRDLDPAGVGV